MVSRTTLLVLFLFVIGSIKAQDGEVTNQIFEGNTLLDTQEFDEAEMAFRKALSKSPERTEALYNLGNTHFNEQDYDEAKQRYFQTQKFADNNSSKHHAFHNMGNVFMKQKDYAKAVETYKNALRNNPQDEETRYNYAVAKELLEKEQQQQDNQDQNQDNKDQGPGFTEASPQKIFKRFYSNRPSKFGEHSGLGLNIAKNIVELHKGAIAASNRINQRGAQVEVLLPKILS